MKNAFGVTPRVELAKKLQNVFNEICNKLIKQFNNNPELYEKAIKELQCRKNFNLQTLQSYGFNIN